mgnify:CR=1 FL=1
MGAFGDKLEITIKGEGANGIVVIDLFEEIAPLHVERMLALASNGNYDGIVFHRVIEGFMAQTGDVQFGKLGDDIENAGRGGSSMPDLVAEFSNIPFDRGVVVALIPFLRCRLRLPCRCARSHSAYKQTHTEDPKLDVGDIP